MHVLKHFGNIYDCHLQIYVIDSSDRKRFEETSQVRCKFTFSLKKCNNNIFLARLLVVYSY